MAIKKPGLMRVCKNARRGRQEPCRGRLCQNVMSESEMRQKQASRSLAATVTQGRATLVAYKNRRLPSVHEESWPRERRECFGSASTSPTMLPQRKRIFRGTRYIAERNSFDTACRCRVLIHPQEAKAGAPSLGSWMG